MAFWLARARDGQHTDFIQRFDPRFWTIDFPRPTMGSVVTQGPDALRADLEFHHRDALAGLIWSSEDGIDHPLMAYATDRDYSRTTLTFRWRSSGILPLDAVNGPTLTIEGKDAAGAPRTWYVRLWNYATGTPTDAVIGLAFSDLAGGWSLAENPDPVHPGAIDRMFVSLVPEGYDPASHDLLPVKVNAWAELSEITCDGDRNMIEIGDVLLPPHGLRMATAYDDGYNQTPARMIRTIRGLGYRDEILHYVGMSHFPALAAQPDGNLLVARPAQLCGPAAAWHASLFAQCQASGYAVMTSLSVELFAQFCPPEWMQRAHDGSPALTGWDPPSSLLSFANAQATQYLRDTAKLFAALMAQAGLPIRFQIGEPWWWVNASGAPCIYDAATAPLLDPAAPLITDLAVPLSQAQKDVLAEAGFLLGAYTQALRQDLEGLYGSSADIALLLFTPTILKPEWPDMPLLTIPVAWRDSKFDRVQVEDYDWLTGGAEALRKQAYVQMDQLLGYPLSQQDYVGGFVLDEADAEEYWLRIDAGLDEAAARGVPRLFVWALPQVCRDGYTRLATTFEDDEETQDMQAFDDVLYPLALGKDAAVSPEFSTAIVLTASGHERRNSQWSDARLRFDVGPGLRSESELGVLLQFFRARRGAARGFRLSDPFDFSSNGMTGTPTMLDQKIGIGDGLTATYQLAKSYGPDPEPQVRPITRPRADSILISVDGIVSSGWALQAGGKIVFNAAPPTGAVIRAGFLFDVPVRFAEDRLDINGAVFAAGEAPSVPLIEIREAA